jgi:uncharacterized membrane protein YqjE
MAAPGKSIGSSSETRSIAVNDREGESLPQLLNRLGEDVMRLVDSQITLLKVELKEEAKAYAVSAGLIGAGAAIALIGFALVNVAIAFGVSTLFAATNLSEAAQFALGFVVTGAFYVLVGAIVVMAMKSRLAKIRPVPDRFVEELRKDKQWLKKEF